MAQGWPATLVDGSLCLRPISAFDRRAWRRIRGRSKSWFGPWDATMPPGESKQVWTFGAMVRMLHRESRAGRQMAFAVEYDGAFIGQVTVHNIVRGSAQFGSIGYWIDPGHARRGLMTRSVKLVIDHLLGEAGLHRVEIAIRPENQASLRLMEKLGIAEYGYAPRYLHIDGDWRDHRLFAVTAEEWHARGT